MMQLSDIYITHQCVQMWYKKDDEDDDGEADDDIDFCICYL